MASVSQPTYYMIYISEGEFKTTYYALSTGFMALGMMIPGMFSGIIQEQAGYIQFFIWLCLCTIPGFVLVKYLNIDSGFGVKKSG